VAAEHEPNVAPQLIIFSLLAFWPFKVVQGHWLSFQLIPGHIWLLLVTNCNLRHFRLHLSRHRSIYYRYRDTACRSSEPTTPPFWAPDQGNSLGISSSKFITLKTETLCYFSVILHNILASNGWRQRDYRQTTYYVNSRTLQSAAENKTKSTHIYLVVRWIVWSQYIAVYPNLNVHSPTHTTQADINSLVLYSNVMTRSRKIRCCGGYHGNSHQLQRLFDEVSVPVMTSFDTCDIIGVAFRYGLHGHRHGVGLLAIY